MDLATFLWTQGFVWGTAVQPLLEPLTDSTRPKAFDVLLLADLVFNHSQHDALLRTCEEVIAQQGSDSAGQASEPVALCFYAHHRPTAELIRRDESFLRNAEARGWDVKLVVENQNAGVSLF